MAEVSRNRLQSRVLLPFARIIMLWGAAIAFFVTVGGFAVGAFLYGQSSIVPTPSEVSPPQLNTMGTWNPEQFAPAIEHRLTNTDRNRLSRGDTIAIIYNTHDLDPLIDLRLSASGLSDRFAVVAPSATADAIRRYRLTATPKLVADLADTKMARAYTLSFAATLGKAPDLRNVSYSVQVTFATAESKGYDANLPAPANDRLPEPPVPEGFAARAAQTLALIIDPMRTPEYFSAYQRALRQIQSCVRDGETYGAALVRELNAHRGNLKRHNALRFEEHVCSLWRIAVAKYEQDEAKRRAEMAAAAMESLAKRATSNFALYIAGAALATFLMLALALALLAIENHVRAIRDGDKA